MSEDIKKMCMLLAAAGFNARRVEELLLEIDRLSHKKILSEFDSSCYILSGRAGQVEVNHQRKAVASNELRGTTADKIVDLLVKESRLTVRQSFIFLEETLKESFPGRIVPPPNYKSGISAWIKTLSKHFSESELLHVASKLRNQIMHGLVRHDDWTLKE